MTTLQYWLEQATRCLSKSSSIQVRTEIQEHYESEREAAMGRGVSAEEADRFAVAALGDAKAANLEYRKVLLTSAEARMLREGNWEGRAICSRPWLKWVLLAAPVAAPLAASMWLPKGVLLLGGIAMGLLAAALFLPVYTPSRGRVYRALKWLVMIAALGLAFGPDALKYSWLLASCLWPMLWIEWTRVSIRRKLPVAEWPKQLYL